MNAERSRKIMKCDRDTAMMGQDARLQFRYRIEEIQAASLKDYQFAGGNTRSCRINNYTLLLLEFKPAGVSNKTC